MAAILIVGALMGVVFAQPARYDQTVRLAELRAPVRLMRTVTTNDTTLADPNAKYWSGICSEWTNIPADWKTCEVSVLAYGDGTGDGDPNEGSAKIKIMAARWFGTAKTVFEGEVTIGELEATDNPETGVQYNSGSLDPNESYKWAEAIDANGLGDLWPGDVNDFSPDSDTTGNLATISFDTLGYAKVWAIITEMDAVTRLSIYVTGY